MERSLDLADLITCSLTNWCTLLNGRNKSLAVLDVSLSCNWLCISAAPFYYRNLFYLVK